MRQLSWNNITVQQFQDIHRLSLSRDLDDIARAECAITILYDMTEHEVENLTISEFNTLAKESAFVLAGESEIPGKPVRRIKIGNLRYSITYDPTKLRHRQYVELMQYGNKPIENMHLIMASIVQPTTWYGKKLNNNVDDHGEVAADMLKARLIDVYHCSVFFCKLFVNSMESIKGYLSKEMEKEWMESQQLMQLINSSQDIMAGSITHEKWQYLKA
jgi:hypothetical protein